jgi:uncharacterized protein
MIRMALLLAGAGLAAATLPAMAQEAPAAPVLIDGTLLDVVAEGTSTRVPDLALIQAGVVTQAASASEAMQQNAAQMTRVLAALRKAGIAERDLQTARVSLNPQYRYENNQPPVLTGYQASNQVSVRFRDIARSGPILDALVREGANNISGPNLTIEKPEAALDEARTAAITKARARAELYAKAAGLRVERIVSISEADAVRPPVTLSHASRGRVMAADATTEMVAGEQELSVSLSVRFLLK